MRLLLALLALTGTAFAGQSIQLATPYTVPLNYPVALSTCAASQAMTQAYRTTVTGFSPAGDYVYGTVASHFTCGHSGRGANIHTYWRCTTMTWDLSGNLVGTSTPGAGAANYYCPNVPLNQPSLIPPSNEVLGNAFVNAGGYMAGTLIDEICGSLACYETLFYPTLYTP